MSEEQPVGLPRELSKLDANLTSRDLALEVARNLFPKFNPDGSKDVLTRLEESFNFATLLFLSGLDEEKRTQALSAIGSQVFGKDSPTISKLSSAFLAARRTLSEGKLLESVTQAPPENKPIILSEVFKRDCVSAGYNVFQLVDVQMSRAEPGKLLTSKKPVFGGGADSFRPIDNYIQRNTGKQNAVENRMRELQNLQQGSRVPESDPRRYRVGNSIVVLADGKDNHTFLIIYGAVSAECMGSWKGGRTNLNNSVVFELEGKDAIDRFLTAIDTRAKTYDNGTEQNYRTICEAMSGVFPEEAMQFTKSHMFHRQEIQEVVDLRKGK